MPRSAYSDNYIVRIYRYNKHDDRRFVGTVEEVGTEGKQAFSNIEELWKILARARQEKRNLKRVQGTTTAHTAIKQ